MYLRVLYGSENKQRLFHYTALTDWFYNRDGVCLQRGTDWVFKYNSAQLGTYNVNQPSTSRQKLKKITFNSQRNVYLFKPNAHQECNPKAHQHTQKLPGPSNLKLSEIGGHRTGATDDSSDLGRNDATLGKRLQPVGPSSSLDCLIRTLEAFRSLTTTARRNGSTFKKILISLSHNHSFLSLFRVVFS